jgi:hypothetical protein
VAILAAEQTVVLLKRKLDQVERRRTASTVISGIAPFVLVAGVGPARDTLGIVSSGPAFRPRP